MAGHRMIRFRGDLEGLRAVAVLLVVLDHLDVPGFRGGFFGVDVFFVLSGYLITSLLVAEYAAAGSISIRAFYVRRARRIIPAALTVVAAVVAAGAVGGASLLWSVVATRREPAGAYFSTSTRAWELALGAVIGIATTSETRLPPVVAQAASASGVVLLVVACAVIGPTTPFPGE